MSFFEIGHCTTAVLKAQGQVISLWLVPYPLPTERDQYAFGGAGYGHRTSQVACVTLYAKSTCSPFGYCQKSYKKWSDLVAQNNFASAKGVAPAMELNPTYIVR
ncbi:hypothetical protein [Rhodoferax sp. PAMC 29310]|uniref:hypothetical protein n=1 Tax=Rhodoferax sp. PAMC 29310 TaxID=2822760 RepID=UPI001B32922B|nr:hypothetical protein [Rhodoferax sp. PAMC 29310]